MHSQPDPAPTMSPVVLPRARALTDALAVESAPPTAAAVATARRLLERGLSDAAVTYAEPVPCLRIRAFDVVQSLGGAARVTGAPFRWTARTARRRVGLAAVRSCLAQPGLAPGEAVAQVIADPGGPTGPGPTGPGSCTDWLAGLSPSARALVQAEATTWATAVWTALDWDRLPSPMVGAPDRWWDWHGRARVAFQGRADLRIPRVGGGGGAHLVVLDGFPSHASRRALTFGALVDALRSDGADAPSRVIGWWPDCGKAWVASVDGGALRACAEDALGAVRRALRAPGPGTRSLPARALPARALPAR